MEELLAPSPLIVLYIDPQDRTITYISPNVARLLGYTPAEVQASPGFWDEHIHSDDQAGVITGIEEALSGDVENLEQEYRFLHRDGAARWLRSITHIDRDEMGAPQRVLAYILDVTGQKAAEAVSGQARAEAERANQAKREFLSRMSHELRTPLNAILGFAQLLELDTLTGDQEENVKHILQAGRHLLDLINEVLDITRIETGRLPLSVEPAPVEEVARESFDLVAMLAIERNVRLNRDSVKPVGWHVLADRQRLKQVLVNLLTNAVKYNVEGGTVALTYDEIAPDRLRIGITDTGPGIPPEKVDRLFVPFERLGAEAAGVEGAGIGLALSKGLVDVMGGQIGVDTQVGRGSTFWVELPLVEAQARRFAEVRREDLRPARLRHRMFEKARTILYIEDNLSNLELVQRLLAPRVRVKLLTAMQGRAGLDLAEEHLPDLILLDIHLPDISGEEVLRGLRARAETRDVPVIIISAEASPGQIRRLLEAGARAYMTKPLDLKKLLALLDEVLS